MVRTSVVARTRVTSDVGEVVAAPSACMSSGGFCDVVAVQEQGEGDATQPGGSLRRVGPFEQGVVVRALRPDVGAPLAQIGELEISLNAYRGEILLFGEGDVSVAPLPDNEAGLEAVRVPGLGQQFLGFRGIVLAAKGKVGIVCGGVARRDLVGRFQIPVAELLSDGDAVDCVLCCLPHLQF